MLSATRQNPIPVVQSHRNRYMNNACLEPARPRCLRKIPLTGLHPTSKIVLLNAQSVRNKTELLETYILQNCLDIFIITETWVVESDHVTLNALTPPGYVSHSVPRNGRGGGIAIVSKLSLGASLQPKRKFRSF